MKEKRLYFLTSRLDALLMEQSLANREHRALLEVSLLPAYRPQVKAYERFLAETGMGISPESIKAFLAETKANGMPYSASTLSLRKTAIFQALQSKAFDIRLKAEIREKSKEIKVPIQDRKIYSEKTLSESDIETLINASRSQENWKGESIALIIETLAKTGLRVSELCGITLQDCTTTGKFTFIQILGKGKKVRRVFLPKDFFQRIRNHFDSQTFLFVSSKGNQLRRRIVHRELTELSVRALGISVNPHLFRHTFATREIKKRGSVKAVSRYLGHSSTSITEEMYNHEEIKPEELFR